MDATDQVEMLAQAGGTTLIGNNAAGETLEDGLGLSGDSLTAGNGAGDFIFSLGDGATVTAGTGSGDFITTSGSGDTATVNGASAELFLGTGETATLNGTGDLAFEGSGYTINLKGTSQTAEDLGAGTNRFITGGTGVTGATLDGGGNDFYEFTSTFGDDTVNNASASAPHGQVLFGSGVTAQDLWLTHTGNNLQIDLLGTTEHVTFTNWFSSTGTQADNIILSDGYQLTNAQVSSLVSVMATYAAANPSFDPTAISTLPSDTTLQAAVTAAWNTSVAIVDSAAVVASELDYLQTLAAASELASITLTDSGTPTLSITDTQLTGDATALGDIVGAYHLAVSDVTAANAATVAAETHVTTVSASDTGANVGSSTSRTEPPSGFKSGSSHWVTAIRPRLLARTATASACFANPSRSRIFRCGKSRCGSPTIPSSCRANTDSPPGRQRCRPFSPRLQSLYPKGNDHDHRYRKLHLHPLKQARAVERQCPQDQYE